MPLPTTGPISLADIATEFGGTPPHSISEYYAAAAGVPGSGAINTGVFYGKTAEIVITATSSASLDLSSAFGSDYGNPIAKRLVVPPNATLGPVSVPPGMDGSLIIENAGEMQGTGGAANGGAGGDAITAHHNFTLLNTGAVRGGGGGGGKGGTGGAGEELSEVREPSSGGYGGGDSSSSYYFLSTIAPPGTLDPYQPVSVWEVMWNGTLVVPTQYAYGSTLVLEAVDPNDSSITYFNANSSAGYEPVYRTAPQQVTTSGGAGGDGGQGKGYNQSLAAGDAGAAGGTNAGDGGNGGQGGDWGQTGIEGSSGANGNSTNGSAGSTGGAAGRAVRMLEGTLTLSNNGVINGET